jgi:hypothetical protein
MQFHTRTAVLREEMADRGDHQRFWIGPELPRREALLSKLVADVRVLDTRLSHIASSDSPECSLTVMMTMCH